jgi:predicted dehydrogenase
VSPLAPTTGTITEDQRKDVPRLAFLGVGWIGRNRMEGLVRAGRASVLAVADTDPEAAGAAIGLFPEATLADGLDSLLDLEPDGLVIATPSALHAEQAIAALERGIPVFCQKPLARNAAEAATVVEAARRADRLLGVDLSYRHVRAVRKVRAALEDGSIGTPFAAEFTFHNAYGPDKAWFKSRDLSGGGCLIDLGTHLVDLARWLLGTELEVASGRVLRQGRPLQGDGQEVEDYAAAELSGPDGLSVSVACSWWLSVGAEALIDVTIHGTSGSLNVQNVDGSFYDFRAELREGTKATSLAEPPDEWGPRALTAWSERLAADRGFDREAEDFVGVSRTIDGIYAAAGER